MQLEKVRKQSLNIKIWAQIKPTNDTLFWDLVLELQLFLKCFKIFFSKPELLVRANIYQERGINLSWYKLLFLFWLYAPHYGACLLFQFSSEEVST